MPHQVLALGILLAGAQSALAGPTPSEPPRDLFERYDVVLGGVEPQTVLTGFFRGGPVAELVAAFVDEKGEGRVRLYGLEDDGWRPRLEATLGPSAQFVDVAHVTGRDSLVIYQPGRLRRLDPETGDQHDLVEVSFDYRAPPEGGIPLVDVTRDLNGDGRDDLVLPGRDGFQVLIQGSGGTFSDPVKLGPPEPHLGDSAVADDYSYGEMGIAPISIPWYLGRVHRLDHDLDGRSDLLFWNRDHFEVHLQDDAGFFAKDPEVFETEVALDSDGEYSLQYGFKMGYSEQTALHSFADLDGDGVADLVTMSLEGPGVLRKHTTYGVHFGSPGPCGITFGRDPDSVIRSEGIRRGMQRHDLDGDGRIDLKFSNIELGVFKLLRAFVANSMAYDLDFYRLGGDAYPEEPTASFRVRANVRGKNAHSPPVMIGDVDGDGRSDLLVGEREELLVYLGVPGPQLFNQQPHRVSVDMPWDDESSIDYPYRPARLVDLHRDGKQDVLVHRRSTSRPHRVTLLIAR